MKASTNFGFWRQSYFLCEFLLQHKKKSFPQTIFFFAILKSWMPKNMCTLRHKVRNGQNLPHESPTFRHFFSK